MTFFADLCQDEKQIEVTFSRRQWLYTIRFYKEESLETYGIIDFQLAPPESSDQIVAIVPWYGLLNNKLDLHDCEEFDEDLISSVVEDLYPILQKEFAKTHCHWIYSNWDFHYEEERLKRGIVIILHSLEYYDGNGE